MVDKPLLAGAILALVFMAGPGFAFERPTPDPSGLQDSEIAPAPFSLACAEPRDFALASGNPNVQPGTLPLVVFSFSAAQGRAEAAAASWKRPWRAGLEVLSIDVLNWAFDRYILNRAYARVGLSSWASNLEHGFVFDPDSFGMNFFAHPYSGSLAFNAARSLGLNFWESLPCAFGGSLLWEMFGENQPPSYNDLIMTTTGGAFLGETIFRLSSLILDDTDTGLSRAGRETLAFLINPVRGLNRLIFGDAFRRQAVNRQLRTAFHGAFGYRATYVSESGSLTNLKFSPGLEFEFVCGESTPVKPARDPFDLLFFNASLRHSAQKLAFTVNAYALLFGNEIFSVTGQRTLIGIFQAFDFINNEIIKLGGSSFTAGIDSSLPLGSDFGLRITGQLGAMVFGASNNKYTLIEERDYNYGLGSVSKIDLWLTHPRFGHLSLRWGHYQVYSIKASALSGIESQDFLTVISAKYGLTFWKYLGFRFEYTLFNRSLQFEGRPDYASALSQVGGSIVIFF